MLALFLSASSPSANAAQPRTNVLLIIADDLNTGIGCYGHPVVKTPNLDRLVQKGVRFDRAYCNYPVCNPSRTSFLSGRLPRSTEVLGNGVDPRAVLGQDYRFLPEHFKDQGYFTAGIGKVSHTPEFLHSIKWDVVRDFRTDADPDRSADLREGKDAPDETQPDGLTARAVAKLMEEHRDKPFFLSAGFHRPHAPRIAPQKYFDMYPLEQLELPTGSTEAEIPKIALPPNYEPEMPEGERRKYLQSYYACVSFMDAQVGVLMAAMDRLDLWKNTVVVFLGDNGYHLGEHGGFWGKMSLMDPSGRVPLIVCAPGMAQQPCARAVSLVDVFPTLTELCQLPAPAGLEGNSLAPLLRDPSIEWKHPARSVVVRGEKRAGHLELGRSVHTDRHSLIQWPDRSLQLYDDQADPKQSRNLATDPAQASLVAQLQQSLLPEDRIRAQKGGIKVEKGEAKKGRKRKSPAAAAEAAPAPRPPNVIVILADDLGYHDLGVHGCEDIQTPHIDSLAKNGMRCTDGYVTAAVCSPSRAGLLTGRYQNRFGFEFLAEEHAIVPEGGKVGLATGEKTIADRMKALGYATGCIGKWHVGAEPEFLPMSRGFEEFYGSQGQSNYFTPTLIDSQVSAEPFKLKVTDGYYVTDDYAARAVRYIEQHKSKPFLLYLPHFAVHKPWVATEKYLSRFPGIADEKRRAFAAMASALDDAVGSLLDALRENQIEENTLIFFLTDNGGTGGVGDNKPLRGGKGSTWEGGFRTPFLVQWKGRLPAGRVYGEPVSSLDILPTALAAAGGTIDPAWKLDGVNLLPYLEGQINTPPHDALYWRFGTQWAVRRGDWKLLQAREGRGGNIQIAKEGPVRLFNLREDISEKNDLAAARPEKVAELRQLWEQWNRELPPPAWKPNATVDE